MGLPRRTLLALAAASVGALGAASAAQAVTITSSSAGYTTNERTPTFTFNNAAPGDVVNLFWAPGDVPAGTAIADPSGSGTIAATSPLPRGTSEAVIEEFRPGDLQHQVGYADVSEFDVDIVPQLDGGAVHDGDTVDAGNVSFDAQTDTQPGFINGWPIVLTVAQQGGPATASAQQVVDGNGRVFGLAPAQPLAAGQYKATATTIDMDSERNFVQAFIPSDPSNAVTFYVAPAEPTITELAGQAAHQGENLNQSAPTITVSGVDAGAQVKLFTRDPSTAQPVLVGQRTADSAGSLDITVAAAGTSALHADSNVLWATQTVEENGTPVSSDGSADAHSPTSTPAALLYANVDTDAPTLGSYDVSDGQTTTNAQPSFTVTGAQANLSENGNTSGVQFTVRQGAATVADSGPVPADLNGNANWQPSAALPDGTYTVSALTVDDTGHLNAANPSGSLTFTVSTGGGSTDPQPPSTNPQPPATNPQPPTTNPQPPATNPQPPATNPQPPTRPQPPAIATPPALSSHALSAAHPVKLTVKLTAPGRVTLQLTGKVHGKTKVIGTVTVNAPSGTASYTLTRRFAGRTLGKGAYTLTLRAAGGKTLSAKLNVR